MHVAERALTFVRGREPWSVLVPLVLVQWLVLAILVASVPHNGWLFYQGGDQTWFYTSSVVLADGNIPETLVGYLWPFVLVPVAALAGANILSGLPAILLFQVLVLMPVAVLCAYAIAARIGGRLLGYLAAAGWIAAPFAAIPFFVSRYHERWIDQTLPQALGLTALGDYPSMVILLVAGVFAVRAIEGGSRGDAVAAGLAAGLAIGLKPANGLFLLAPVVGLALARRWRSILEFGLAVAPAVLTLAVWKYRGTGIAFLSLDQAALAAEAPPPPPPHPSELEWWERAREYVPIDVDQINYQFIGLREYFWSARLLEWSAVAGALAVARRSVPIAGLLAAWLAAFLVVKGSSEAVTVETASIWRLLMPAWPALFFLIVSIPLLVPVWGSRLADRFSVPLRRIRWPRWLVAVAVVLVAVPLVGTLVLPPSDGSTAAKLPLQSLFLPTEQDVGLQVTPEEGGLRVRWNTAKPGTANSFFILYRSPLRYTLSETDPRVIVQGRLCEPTDGAPRCTIEMQEVGRTREGELLDRPARGDWTYRVGLAANYLDDEGRGDPLVLSRPLNVSVR
jgi:hypothetical protein